MTPNENAMCCVHCGARHSRRGFGLIYSVRFENGPPVSAVCIDCGVMGALEGGQAWNWFPTLMPAVFEMTTRIPWVPTADDAALWELWRVDHWFANRRGDVW